LKAKEELVAFELFPTAKAYTFIDQKKSSLIGNEALKIFVSFFIFAVTWLPKSIEEVFPW